MRCLHCCLSFFIIVVVRCVAFVHPIFIEIYRRHHKHRHTAIHSFIFTDPSRCTTQIVHWHSRCLETPFVCHQKSIRSAHDQRYGMATGDFIRILSDFVCCVFRAESYSHQSRSQTEHIWIRNEIVIIRGHKRRGPYAVRCEDVKHRNQDNERNGNDDAAVHRRDNNGSRRAQKKRTIDSINTFTDVE